MSFPFYLPVGLMNMSMKCLDLSIDFPVGIILGFKDNRSFLHQGVKHGVHRTLHHMWNLSWKGDCGHFIFTHNFIWMWFYLVLQSIVSLISVSTRYCKVPSAIWHVLYTCFWNMRNEGNICYITRGHGAITSLLPAQKLI